MAWLTRASAIRGVSRRRGFVVTTQRDQQQRPALDLVERELKADGPNQLWVADMTYVPTCQRANVGRVHLPRPAPELIDLL